MKKYTITFLLAFFAQVLFAQNVFLKKVENTNNNKDKFFYQINPQTESADYLGEIEVQGYTRDDIEIFNQIYKKAKEIGANAFSLNPIQSVDGGVQKFNPSNYFINLYYLPKYQFALQDNSLYLFASSAKSQKITINREKYTIQPRTYIQLSLEEGKVYTISTNNILGSTIKVKNEKSQSNQYFQISSLKIGGNNQNDGTLHLKSGDIIGLERSYAEFLRMIYEKNK
ncbi:hypothetical protein [Chryseobacterium sp.]|uniref:hypothetical protein n=1 Tax=Chryseobacterium sp. TaxID=1871047 RepID=UPI0038907508